MIWGKRGVTRSTRGQLGVYVKNGEKMLRETVDCRSHAIFFRHSAVLSPTAVLLSMVSINKSGVNGMQRGQLGVCMNKLCTTRLTRGIRG